MTAPRESGLLASRPLLHPTHPKYRRRTSARASAQKSSHSTNLPERRPGCCARPGSTILCVRLSSPSTSTHPNPKRALALAVGPIRQCVRFLQRIANCSSALWTAACKAECRVGVLRPLALEVHRCYTPDPPLCVNTCLAARAKQRSWSNNVARETAKTSVSTCRRKKAVEVPPKLPAMAFLHRVRRQPSERAVRPFFIS